MILVKQLTLDSGGSVQKGSTYKKKSQARRRAVDQSAYQEVCVSAFSSTRWKILFEGLRGHQFSFQLYFYDAAFTIYSSNIYS